MDDRIQLLGEHHLEWGLHAVKTTRGARSAAAISIGSDPDSPSMKSKGDPELANEDAALVLEDGPRTLLAVADAHHGHRASHDIISALAALDAIPGRSSSLGSAVRELEPAHGEDESASTLLVAVVDRAAGLCFGFSFGDSSLVRVSDSGAARINVRHAAFVHLRGPDRIDPAEAHEFRFFCPPGELVLAHTDGVDECHYHSPATSVRTAHLGALFAETGTDVRRYANSLMELALAGVDGHPGGQDNVAIALTRTGMP